MSVLTDRIRGIVAPLPGPKGPGLHPSDVGRVLLDPPPATLERTLGGVWRDRCFVVERRWEPTARHGRESIGSIAERVAQSAGEAGLFAIGAPRAPFVFFDLETTGLSGGAGTQAFLVGCGSFEDDGAFVTRQFLLTRYADERTLLGRVTSALACAGALVSFNGKSFDAPVLETRYLFHRLDWVGAGVPHVDVLHPARRFWGQGRAEQAPPLRATVGAPPRTTVGGPPRTTVGGPPRTTVGAPPRTTVGADLGRPRSDGNCSLAALERRVVGARRAGDVPGFEIPARYFQFVRSGDPRPLVAVLEHNRLDLLTLAALTGRLLHLSRVGPDEARDACEALALGRMYARAGFEDRARESLFRSIEMSRAPRGAFDPIRIEGLRALALAWRRVRQYDEAAACWQQLVDTRGCPPIVAREATEALAIHHEHRVRDFAAARTFAMRSLEAEARPAWTRAVHHRIARIERKLSERPVCPSSPLLPSCGFPQSGRRTSS